MKEANIRQLGDRVLHRTAGDVEYFTGPYAEEMHRQIDIMKASLVAAGGVGIAANQCGEIADPLKIILVGVDYSHPGHASRALARYPSVVIPQMKTCINPVIAWLDEEYADFAEGCLSIRGMLRGVARRPKSVSVRYQDTQGNVHEEKFEGMAARIMLHELDHILNGKVYLQAILEELSPAQGQSLLEIIDKIFSCGKKNIAHKIFSSPVAAFYRKKDGSPGLDGENILDALCTLEESVLNEIKNMLQDRIIPHVRPGG